MYFVERQLAILVVCTCGAAFADRTQAVDLQIMAVGDSITYGGGGGNAGYRGPLYNLLATAGVSVQFVGDSTLNPGSLPSSQVFHSGHSSYTTYDIANNLNGLDTARYEEYGGSDRDPHGGYWITGGHGTGRDAILPDVVLLLVGSNDLSKDQDANAQANLRALLAEFTTLLPDAKVLIADLPPEPTYGSLRVNAWNAAVDEAVSYFQSVGKKVYGVDLNTDFPSNGLTSDGVHPNDVGYVWMAGQWNAAITALSVPEPSVTAILTTGLLAAVACVRRRTK